MAKTKAKAVLTAGQRVEGSRWALRRRGHADALVPLGSVHSPHHTGRHAGGAAAEVAPATTD